MYKKTVPPVNLDDPISPHVLEPDTPSDTSSDGVLRNSVDDSIKSTCHEPSKFLEFPKEVIRHILWSVDANTFASLCLLNRQWHTTSHDTELYAYHLSRCPSYALSNSVLTGPFEDSDLPIFKARFANEVRRNLFDAYTRPRRTFIKLVSISANSAAAFPGGEAFRFEFSPNGKTILALSSSRIYVLDASADSIIVKRELKTLRRPLSASITDDGSLLAVLSSKFQANVYGLPPDGKIKHLQVIVLEHAPKTIAIAHEGTVLAAAYDTGVEVFSLAANALSTDRRAVRSEAVDILTFSGDGSMLVGSSLNLDEPNAVVISAPFYTENDPDLTPREAHSRMWTTQILFPQISSVCSHVTLLSGHAEGDATWLFAYDHSLLSYRAVRTDDTRSGAAYFLTPPGTSRFSLPSPTIAPIASTCGTLAVAGFSGTGLCLYGIPEKLDIDPDMAAVVARHEQQLQAHGSITTATGNIDPLLAYSPSMTGVSESIEDDTIASKVDWRESLFVKCRAIESIKGHTAAKWVDLHDHDSNTPRGKRLIVVAPGGLGTTGGDFGEEPVPLDGSRLCLLDFDYAPSHADDRELTIEVGDNETELLVEHTGSIATEVALERRRTIRGMPGGENARRLLGRSITAITPSSNLLHQEDSRRQSVSQPSSPVEEPIKRRQSSASSLQRSASATGFRHALYPPRPPLGSQSYMPAGVGPHGRPGSIDSWETPPPPYIDRNSLHALPGQNPQQVPVESDANGNPTNSANQQSGYMPYHNLPSRGSVGMDGMPITDSGPVRRSMSQYGALARNQRLRDTSITSLNTVSETPINRHAVKSMDLSSSTSGFESLGQAADSHFQRPRPFTHYGSPQRSNPRMAANLSGPISPLTSPEGTFIGTGPVSPEQTSRLSLTGANLQNRLNLPVPPVPEEEPAVPSIPEQHLNSVVSPAQQPSQVLPTTISAQMPPSSPPHTQRLDQPRLPGGQFQQSTPPRKPVPGSTLMGIQPDQIQPSPPNVTNTAWHDVNNARQQAFQQPAPHIAPASHVVDSTPHMNSGMQGIGSAMYQQPPLQEQAHFYAARNSQASASTPNLLRPAYNTRLDNIETIPPPDQPASSPGIAFNIGRRMSRAQSMIQAPLGRDRQRPSRQYREQSAYAETVTMSTKSGRKGKKKDKVPREESERGGSKKGSRCRVM